MILSTSMKHGGQYHFRIHQNKLEKLSGNGLEPLKLYLQRVRVDCPNDYFQKGPRSSVLKIKINSKAEEKEHEVKGLARMGLESVYYDNAHMNVQMFMLAYDNKTIAIEVPLWLEPHEHEKYNELFKSTEPLTGHIDLIRIEDEKIWIWDYKPKAYREKYADTQTYFYAVMLSKRTGIPLKKFVCGYFDDKNSYIFEPSKIEL